MAYLKPFIKTPLFITLLEGNCTPSPKIEINFLNTLTQKVIFKNIFFTK
jgi:hypothetical protein